MIYNKESCIKIYDDEGNIVVLPRTRNIIIGGDQKYTEIEMASGKRVRDIVGYRTKVTAEYDYIPSKDLITLQSIARKCTYVTAEYLDVDGRKSMKCSINIPESGIFQFKNDIPVWHKAKLELVAQEVI